MFASGMRSRHVYGDRGGAGPFAVFLYVPWAVGERKFGHYLPELDQDILRGSRK